MHSEQKECRHGVMETGMRYSSWQMGQRRVDSRSRRPEWRVEVGEKCGEDTHECSSWSSSSPVEDEAEASPRMAEGWEESIGDDLLVI
mmetsp:Transcript_31041/g.93112  ORF Transcript_31041/g.93112 Transcript_31041/m.93112 type:complete len:88 (+) Transcript_31041:1710-1973(+)